MSESATPIPGSTTHQPPRPRRWIPLSLRMFVAITVLLGLGSIVWTAWSVQRQKSAIRAIQELRGQVDLRAGGPAWLKKMLREPLFDEVVRITCTDLPATDETLRRISGLTNLEELGLYSNQITDAGLMHVEGLAGL